MIYKRPYIHLKWAQTISSHIADNDYNSKWITNDLARVATHKERYQYDGILIGKKTLLEDNPGLTIRDAKGNIVKVAKRIVATTRLDHKSSYKLFSDEYKEHSMMINLENLNSGLQQLYVKGIRSVYVEGGARLLASFLEADLYDEISVYMAPKILSSGKSIGQNLNFPTLRDALDLGHGQWDSFGDNVRYNMRRVCSQD